MEHYGWGRHGTTYPEVPWEPEESFTAVAKYHAEHWGRFEGGTVAPALKASLALRYRAAVIPERSSKE